jgi:hypothetical protein
VIDVVIQAAGARMLEGSPRQVPGTPAHGCDDTRLTGVPAFGEASGRWGRERRVRAAGYGSAAAG